MNNAENDFKRQGPKVDNILGLQHKLLTVTGYDYCNGQLRWKCTCKCGNVAYVRSRKHLETRIGCKSCTAKARSAKKHPTVKHYGQKMRKYREYAQGASKRGLTFNISSELFLKLITQDCTYCGETPETFHGVDRVDSSKGYEPDNVVSCCSKCNYAKHALTLDEYKKWLVRAYNHLIK